MIFRAVFHVVVPEETNSDMFNGENNIELSAILILCLGLIINTSIVEIFFPCRNLVNRLLMYICMYICTYVYIHSVHIYI